MYETETGPQTQRADVWLPRGRRGGRDKLGVCGWQMRARIQNREAAGSCWEQRGLQQRPGTDHSGEEFKKDCVCVCVCVRA